MFTFRPRRRPSRSLPATPRPDHVEVGAMLAGVEAEETESRLALAEQMAASLRWCEVRAASFDAERGSLRIVTDHVTVTAATSNPLASQVPDMVALEQTMVHAAAHEGRVVLYVDSPSWSFAIDALPAAALAD